jgi:hypothetical protein
MTKSNTNTNTSTSLECCFCLLSLFVGFCDRKEGEGLESEKEGSKLREVEWFSGVRNNNFSKIPILFFMLEGKT